MIRTTFGRSAEAGFGSACPPVAAEQTASNAKQGANNRPARTNNRERIIVFALESYEEAGRRPHARSRHPDGSARIES
jgi:hypothetical protein